MEEQLVVLMDPWHDKYDRLLEAHEKIQRLNQNLEDKLLKMAERNHSESQKLTYQVQELTQRLVEARLYIHQLEDENDRYRSDINVVVQLLHCKPSNFVSPKLDALPDDLQRKVYGLRNGSNCKKEKKIIKVQVPTFPPTDIMYSIDKGKGKKNSEKDIVSAAIMAKILQERENERKENRKNRCKCASKIVLPLVHSESQTMPTCTISYSDFNFSDFEDDDDVDVVDDDEDEDEDIIYEKKTPTNTKAHNNKTPSSPIKVATVDDIMKPDQKEEELLPTPLFLRRNNKKETLINMKHESQDSTYSSGSSGCGSSSNAPTTNSSNSNISHSSRMSSEETNFSGTSGFGSGPSPTCTNSVSSPSPDIILDDDAESHFLEEFDIDPDSIIQGLSYCQSSIASSNSNCASGQNYFNFENIGRKPPRPHSMQFGQSGGLSSWDTHWRSTVLVHHPPKSHSYEPLSQQSQTTTFSSPTKSSLVYNQPATHDDEEDEDEEEEEGNPLLDENINLHSPSRGRAGLRGYSQAPNQSNNAQYFRPQKLNFWGRSSTSTMSSTETEI